MANYNIPGVYVEEITKFPPSVAQVETAIPAFIGYTERRIASDGSILAANMPVRISSLTEFETLFGNAPRLDVTEVHLDADNNFLSADISTTHYLYHALQLFYANGGGDCYIVSVGVGGFTAIDAAEIALGVAALESYDEPTILCFPDAASLSGAPSALYGLQQQALLQCANLGDRVTICEVEEDNPLGTNLRDNIGINNLKYGMAYTPWLRALLPKNITYNELSGTIFTRAGISSLSLSDLTTDTDIINAIANYDFLLATSAIANIEALRNDVQSAYNTYIANTDLDDANASDDLNTAITAIGTALSTATITPSADYTTALAALNSAITDYDALTNASTAPDVATALGELQDAFNTYLSFLPAENSLAEAEENLQSIFGLYKAVIIGINGLPLSVPPSGAIAGVYATVDRTRGVWKAPANVSLNNVLAPLDTFTQAQLGALNIDTTAGKSINAIRSFTGKGTLVWGARTLAGNDNEWRYINVRRFLNMVEESVKKASEYFVFEPNDANTWVRIQAMIENFLSLQWRAGALQGAKQEHAFQVAVGLGKTMTADDVLNGKMIIQIAVAPVRPAEFIILRFEQKMPES